MGRTVRSLVAAGVAVLMLPVAATSAVSADTDISIGAGAQHQRGHAAALAAPDAASPQQVPGELLVRFRAGTTASQRADVRAGVDATLLDRLAVPGLERVHVGPDVAASARALEHRPDVLYAEPNFTATVAATPNDPAYPRLWGLHNTGQFQAGQAGAPDADIDAPEAWEHTTGDSAVTVAVVDSGVAIDHPDLDANIWSNPREVSGNGEDDDANGYVDDVHGWDWVDGDRAPHDLNGHGTHVAGTIGAVGDNGVGVTGVAWDVSLMPLRALGADGSGSYADIIDAFAYAAVNGADVVNASLGGPYYSQALHDVIARSPDTLFVVAAGNNGSNNETATEYPCNYQTTNLICVAATDNRDRLAAFSNYGATSVDLAAPGASILSTVPAEEPVWSEDFEDIGWSTRWTSGGTAARWGLETDEYGDFLSDSPGGVYANHTDTWVRTAAPVDLSGRRDCTVSYWLDLDVERSYDHLWVEASTDGASWSPVASWSDDFADSWVAMRDSLSRFDGRRFVYLRFRLTSDEAEQRDGVKIDDVVIACQGAYSGDEYASFDGTSMASPHVAGAAALLYAADRKATVAGVRAALLEGVEPLPSLTDQTATGGRLNIRSSLDVLLGGPVEPTDPTDPTEPTPPTDTAAPDTGIVSTPRATTTERTATFSFTASEPDASFTCSLDGRAFTTCRSPVEYADLAPGTHAFEVGARDAAGNTDDTPARYSWVVENTAPTDVRIGGLPTRYTTATDLRVLPDARDVDGVDHFDVRYRVARYDTSYSSWKILDADLPVGEGVQMGVPSGYTVCFSARATDARGATSTWSPSRCTAVPLDDRGLATSRGWTRRTESGTFRGTLIVSSRRGAALSARGARIRRVALVATRGPGSGTVDVYLGRTRLKRVSLAAAATRRRQVIPVATWASSRSGTLRVIVTTSGKPVRLDGLALGR